MNKPNQHFHGSDVEKIQEVYGIKKESIINFAGNVNPLGVSPILKNTLANNIDIITSYPERNYNNLRNAIGKYTNTTINNVLVGNGSTELISLLIKIILPKKALILGPTYSEYEREVSLSGGQAKIIMTSNPVTHLSSEIDMLIICNPNNPTSSAINVDEMTKIITACKELGIFVMIDETYVEFAPNINDISAIPLINKFDNLIVLRGISKFFASPGLRLGYALGSESLINKINQQKNPWTINSLAALAGEVMFFDELYIKDTRELINTERERIWNILKDCKNIKVNYPIANFILVEILDDNITAKDIFEAAIKEGLMIRDCSSFEGLSNKYFRFCFMKPEDNDKLLQIIFDKIPATK